MVFLREACSKVASYKMVSCKEAYRKALSLSVLRLDSNSLGNNSLGNNSLGKLNLGPKGQPLLRQSPRQAYRELDSDFHFRIPCSVQPWLRPRLKVTDPAVSAAVVVRRPV